MAQYVEMPDKSLAEFPDDWSPEQIEASIAEAMAPRGSAPASATGASPKDAALRLPEPSYNRDWERAGYRAIPGVAAGLGALIGTPAGPAGQIGFAGLLGGGGEAVSQLLQRARGMGGPETPAEAWAAINKQASGMATAEALGIPIAAGVKALGTPLMKAGIRATPTLNKEFPGLAETAMKERITSASQATIRRKASAANTRRLLRLAERRGVKFTTTDIADAVIRENERRARRSLTNAERANVLAMVRERANELLDELTPGASRMATAPPYPGGVITKSNTFNPTEVKDLAQSAQAEASALIRAEPKVGTVRSAKNLDRRIARGAVKAKNRIKGVAKSEARTQRLIGLERALVDEEARSGKLELGRLTPALVGGAGAAATGHGAQTPLGMLLGYAATDPWLLRRAALLSQNPLLTSTVQHSPLAAATLWQALTQAPPAQEER